MRTRLDEIVEEECIKGYDGTVAKRIAERAFRHGAERHALWVKSVGDAAANVVPKMVPAPAEETYQIRGVPWGSVRGGWIDRRHGERRSVVSYDLIRTREAPGNGPVVRLYHISNSMDGKYYRDRRSGEDRRKP